MKRFFKTLAAATLGAMLTISSSLVRADIYTTPPASFKKVSTLVKLPDYLPGMGTLYVDPATLPIGPFLGYDKAGRLVNVIYMVPLRELEAHKAWSNLGQAAAGLKVDHTDLEFNPGHPGVEEPHYHFVQWLVTPAEQAKLK